MQTDRQTSMQTDRQACRQKGRQTGMQTERQTDRQAGRQAGRQTGRQAGRQFKNSGKREHTHKKMPAILSRLSLRKTGIGQLARSQLLTHIYLFWDCGRHNLGV